jgi:protein-glutamine gamma-glutamyltransferase
MPDERQLRRSVPRVSSAGEDRVSQSGRTDEITLTTGIRRYFDVALYLLIFTAFGTLASTGRLGPPTVVLVTAGLLVRGYTLARRQQIRLSESWTNLFTIACLGFFVADEFLISRSFLTATVHLVLFVMLVRLFSAQHDRDHYFLAVLSFLMVLSAAVLTVDSTFLFALAGFVLVAVATFILMEMMHASQRSAVQARDPHIPRAYRKLSFAIAGIAPVLLLLIFLGAGIIFFLFPRVSAGYLGGYTSTNDLTSGFSDHVDFGGIGRIQQSKAVVMHVQIEGDTTGAHQLKLRGVILDRFDGHSWTNTQARTIVRRGPDARFDLCAANCLMAQGRAVRYHVTMEPLLNNVFFLLARPRFVAGNFREILVDNAGDAFNSDLEHPVTQYEAESVLRSQEAGLSPAGSPGAGDVLNSELQLPRLDPRIRPLALKITSGESKPFDKAVALENYLQTHYGYTLQLPGREAASRDPIAYFLFVRRQGHCEYFASAMAVMLRAIGIPARVVNGFSGGEFNDINSRYVIRASDAHSWVDAYLPGQGWVEFDPTPASGLESKRGWSRFMLYMDAMSSFWREWVVNYDLAHQFRLTQDASRGSRAIVGHAQSWSRIEYARILEWARQTQEKVTQSMVKAGTRVLALLLLVLLIGAIPRAASALRKLRLARNPQTAPQTAATIWYQRMVRQIAKRGWNKSPAQTPEEFIAIISQPQLKNKVVVFTHHYEKARFGKSAEEASYLPQLYQEIKAQR